MTKKAKIGKIIGNIVMVSAIVLLCAYMVMNSITGRVIVSGSSMNPTLSNLDYGIMNTSKTKRNNIKRFDIVIFEDDTSGILIKRVIGLPGEKININTATGELRIDDKVILQDFLADSYVSKTCHNSHNVACGKDFTVPKDQYYVLGDNRANSKDSEHGIGTVAKNQMLGVLWYIDSKCGTIETKLDKNGNEVHVCKDQKRTEVRFF